MRKKRCFTCKRFKIKGKIANLKQMFSRFNKIKIQIVTGGIFNTFVWWQNLDNRKIVIGIFDTII